MNDPIQFDPNMTSEQIEANLNAVEIEAQTAVDAFENQAMRTDLTGPSVFDDGFFSLKGFRKFFGS